MGRMVMVVYRPKPGREPQLEEAIRDHLPVLRKEGLATERAPLVMRAGDGAYVEIFEWKSPEAIERAHSNPAVQALWQRFFEACEFGTLASLPGADGPFPGFEAVEM